MSQAGPVSCKLSFWTVIGGDINNGSEGPACDTEQALLKPYHHFSQFQPEPFILPNQRENGSGQSLPHPFNRIDHVVLHLSVFQIRDTDIEVGDDLTPLIKTDGAAGAVVNHF